MSIKAVLFDLDGTLLDTAPDFVVTVQQMAKEYNIPSPSDNKIRSQVSNGARALIKLLFNLNEGDEGFEIKRQRLFDVYESIMGKHCVLFEGMFELIENLNKHQIDWGIITNKPARFAEPIVENLTLPSKPAILLCPDHVVNAKPHPEAMILACNQLHCSPAETFYVGDHKRDIDCGRIAGSHTIAVNYGYIAGGDDVNSWQADYIVESASDIFPIIQEKL